MGMMNYNDSSSLLDSSQLHLDWSDVLIPMRVSYNFYCVHVSRNKVAILISSNDSLLLANLITNQSRRSDGLKIPSWNKCGFDYF